jgi:DNA-binding transcriptional MerR regulator
MATNQENWYKIKEFSQEVGIHHNTIYSWFDRLEGMKIHYGARLNNGMRVFDNSDMQIINFIHEKRSTTFNLEGALLALKEQYEIPLRPFPSDFEQSQNKEVSTETIKHIMEGQLKEIITSEVAKEKDKLLKELTNEINKQLPAPEDKEKQLEELRTQRLNDLLLQKRVTSKLRSEALNEWSNKPEDQRQKRVGFFRKEEDISSRDEFINKYIDENYEKVLREELGVGEM